MLVRNAEVESMESARLLAKRIETERINDIVRTELSYLSGIKTNVQNQLNVANTRLNKIIKLCQKNS